MKIFHSTTTIVPREFGRVFGFDNHHTHEKEAIASPPPTITRRTGQIPQSPIPQSMTQSNEQPTEPPIDTFDIDKDIYENEHITSIPIRKRPLADIRA